MKKEDFINTKWDAREWTPEGLSWWLSAMRERGFKLFDSDAYPKFFIVANHLIFPIESEIRYNRSDLKEMKLESIFPQHVKHLEGQRAKARFDASIDATLAERGSRYGEFEDGAAIMQSLKGVMKSTGGWARLSPPQREALEMIQHKIGRILNGDPNYADSWVDIAGYAKLISDNLEDE